MSVASKPTEMTVKIRSSVWMVLWAVALGGCSSPGTPGEPENCSNGVDDNGDGQVDCADPICSSTPACVVALVDAGSSSYGLCAKCGTACTQPQDCFSRGFLDEPLPQCLGGKCTALLEGVRIRFEVDTRTTWTGVSDTLRSMNTRFVLKTAIDGSPVTCARLAAAASSKQGADSPQLERSGKFNFLAYDVTPLQTPAAAVPTQPRLPVGTGRDFIIWTELWNGPPDSTTKMPTGIRLGWGCFETGPEVAEIKTQDNWPMTGGPTPYSRTLQVKMPASQ